MTPNMIKITAKFRINKAQRKIIVSHHHHETSHGFKSRKAYGKSGMGRGPRGNFPISKSLL